MAVDAGSQMIKVVIAEINEQSEPTILGFGTANSRGIKNGQVIDIFEATDSISTAIDNAEKMANLHTELCIATLSGDHIKGLNTSSAVIIDEHSSDSDLLKTVNEEDIDKLISHAKAIDLPVDWKILHLIPQEFVLDNQSGIKNPINLSCRRLEARIHLIAYNYTSAINLKRSIENTGVKVTQFFSHSLASAYGTLYKDEMELGAILIDIGSDNTKLSVFYSGGIYQTSIINNAGKNITTDIAYLMQIPLSTAENLKKEYGSAIPNEKHKDKEIQIELINGSKISITKYTLASYIEPRVEEIFSDIKNECRKANLNFYRTFPVVITGGTANLQRIDELAELVFETKSRTGLPYGFSEMPDELKKPEFAASLGLLRCFGELSKKSLTQTKSFKKRKFKWLENLLKKIL